MKIFDSLSKSLKDIKTISKLKHQYVDGKYMNGIIRLFVCGPTVYDCSHIGHSRTYISFDIIVRWMRYRKLNVFYLQNITDVDDKIINRAKEKNITPKELAERYESEYHQAEKTLNIKSVNKYARASNYIKEIIKQIETLIKKGFAYEIEDGIYFEVSKFKKYGKLSRQNIKQMKSGIRICINEDKKSPIDFALWKKSVKIPDKETRKKFMLLGKEPIWKSPWGWGRPGWHIEDTAITEKTFGPQYEVHGGASELKFPHHEAEIAQEESASGKSPIVKIWMHTGVLLINKRKMSKSLKNFITISDFVKKYGANTLRMLVLKHHYRSPINYTDSLVYDSKKDIESVFEFLRKLSFVKKNTKHIKSKNEIDTEKYRLNFDLSMDNDFNTPKAIAVLFSLISKAEKDIYNINSKDAGLLYEFILSRLKILGFDVSSVKQNVPKKVRDILKQRKRARDKSQFMQADNLRKKIKQLGYTIEDTSIGQYITLNKYDEKY